MTSQLFKQDQKCPISVFVCHRSCYLTKSGQDRQHPSISDIRHDTKRSKQPTLLSFSCVLQSSTKSKILGQIMYFVFVVVSISFSSTLMMEDLVVKIVRQNKLPSVKFVQTNIPKNINIHCFRFHLSSRF